MYASWIMTNVAGEPKGTESVDLLGRSHQLLSLRQSLAPVVERSRGRLVLVSGEAGVGKTWLLQRFCEQELGAPLRILSGACDPLFTPTPLGPFLEIAEAVGGEFEELVGSSARPYEVVAALTRELVGRPTVIVLEDLHWADGATLDALRLLGRRVESVATLVLASYRDDGLGREHPLRIVVGELATRPSVERLHVERLSPAAVASMA